MGKTESTGGVREHMGEAENTGVVENKGWGRKHRGD